MLQGHQLGYEQGLLDQKRIRVRQGGQAREVPSARS
jgi:hypothetical protein